MKIVFLSDDFPPRSFGGAGFSTYELALGMKKEGHEVFVITTCRNRSEAGEMNYHGLRVFSIASDYPGKWRAYISIYNPMTVKRVEELLKEIKPDVVHANNIHLYLSYHCLKVSKQHAKVVIFTARDVMTFNFAKLTTKQYLEHFDSRTTWRDHLMQAKKRWNPLRNFLIKRYLRNTDKIFAVSDALRSALLQNGIENIETMYTGIDADAWHIREHEVTLFRKKYNVGKRKVILFGGRLGEAKGGLKMIEAMKRIAKKVPDAVLVVVGKKDWYAEEMNNTAHELGIGEKIIFTGWISGQELQAAYTVSDIVCIPSLYLDPFPRVALEAMAMGKGVVGTCYGGTPEVVIDGVTGYVVNPLHPEEIAEKTIDLLKNPEKAKRFGEAGYERVKNHFNLGDKINELSGWYRNLLEQAK